MKKAVFVILLIVFVLITFTACTASVPGQSAAGDPSAEKETAVPEVKETPVSETEAPIAETEEPTEEPAKEEPTEEPEPTPEPTEIIPLHKADDSDLDRVRADFDALKACMDVHAIPMLSVPLENIPVYYEDDLLTGSFCGPISWGNDGAEYSSWNQMCRADYILADYPGFVYRKFDLNYGYLVYDTDTGYRLFIYFSNNSYYRRGVPVILKKGAALLDREAFAELKVGDTMDDVCAVDPIVELYKKAIAYYFNGPDPQFDRAQGLSYFNWMCMSSMHYLSDGLLKIDYKMTDDYEVLISNITYSEHYRLPDSTGNAVDYKLCELDIP